MREYERIRVSESPHSCIFYAVETERNGVKTVRFYINLYISIFTRVNYSHTPQIFLSKTLYDTLWAIWYHLYNFKNVKNTNGGVLLLVNCTNGTKWRKACHI